MRQLKINHSITLRDSTSLDKYLSEVAKHEMISVEEEVDLAKRIREGDTSAIHKLTLANLRFVVSVAKQYQNQGLTLPDLINEGNLGLLIAAQKFDETRGFKFISYAVWWIRQSIMGAIHERGRIVRLPLNQLGLLSKYHKAYSKFEQSHERAPNIDEIADIIEVEPDKISGIVRNANRHISIDTPFTEGYDISLLDVTPDKDAPQADTDMIKKSISQEIDRAMSVLNDREAYVIRNLFGIGTRQKSLFEIGDTLKLSSERCRQIQNIALRKLKKQKKLLQFLN